MSATVSTQDLMFIIGEKEVRIKLLETDLNNANNLINQLVKDLQDAGIYDKEGKKIEKKSNIVEDLKKNLEGK